MRTQMEGSTAASQKGLTLIELLIALVLGMVVSAAIFTVFVSSSRSTREDEQFRLVLESGRYAMNVLRDELRMVAFWGTLASPADVTTALAVASGSCAEAVGLFNPEPALLFNNGHTTGAAQQFSPCSAMSSDQLSNTDILIIKRVEGTPAARTITDRADLDGDGDTAETLQIGHDSLQVGVVYLRGTGTGGRFISDASAGNPPALGESDWRLASRAYFIRDHFRQAGDGIPSLCRLSVVGVGLGNAETNTQDQAECFVPGIEDLHVEFGLDTDNNGIADQYTATPSAADMERAVSAHIYVLARARTSIAGYQNAKSYQLGSTTRGPFNDGFYRSLFTTTVALRNPINLARFR